MEAQRRLEQEKCESPDCAAEPTGRMLAAVFSHGVAGELQRRVLQELGRHIGKCVYFMDAADDYEKDQKRKNYNPFLYAGVTPKQNTQLRDAIRLELTAAAGAFALLPMRDAGIHAVIENILYEGLPRKIDCLLAFSTEEERLRVETANAQERLEATHE
jgi:hypothetical protein